MGFRNNVLFILGVFCLHIYLGDCYNVAVVEHVLTYNFSISSSENLEKNTETYLQLIENAIANHSQDLDLIVFPELTLTLLDASATLPNSSIVLCNSTDNSFANFLKNFSCAAIKHNLTIVINFTEKESCDDVNNNCTDSKLYNTNAAFAANGSIIARYRKWNLFGEIGKSKPPTLDLPIIEIKNETFGMMTCFDIQFGIPAFNLTKEYKVDNVIFPLYWISELPYLTALQTEQMWAQEFDVVLLASGASAPTSGAGGSGIFYGNRGALQTVMLPQRGTKILTQQVQRDNITFEDISSTEAIDDVASTMDRFYMLVDPSIKDHNSVVLQSSTDATVCHGESPNVLCCHFNISLSIDNTAITTNQSYTYQLVAFNGVRTYSGFYYGGVETCGVVACLNSSVSSCGQRFRNYSEVSWPITFNSINITANFIQSESRIQYATTLLSSIRPLNVQEYSWTKQEVDDLTVRRQIELQTPQNRLLTFGIFGRDFDRDWDPIRNNTIQEPNKAVKSRYETLLLSINILLLLTLFLQ